VLIAYSDFGNSSYGTFVIGGKSELMLEEVDQNEVRLHNHTEETLELLLSVNQ